MESFSWTQDYDIGSILQRLLHCEVYEAWNGCYISGVGEGSATGFKEQVCLRD